jgi:phosphate starvation-inducible protein PhoH
MPAHQMKQSTRLTKKQRRVLRQQGVLDKDNNLAFGNGFNIRKDIKPKTINQRIAFESWRAKKHLMLHGIAGTGKTFLALYFAINSLFEKNTGFKKVYIIRSVVPSRDMGFLPGGTRDKVKVYEAPYYDICTKLFDRGDAYDVLKNRGSVEFASSSFLRGTTFDDCIIVVDEVQNMNDQELHTIMTRVGENCRIIFCGDVKQDDLTSERFKETSGLSTFMKIIRNMSDFKFIEFLADDIVRSRLVKSYIIERDKLGL